jgi:hypothetical protein
MPEISGFERSLAGVFLRLADQVPGAVDAAAVAHRVALEHPRRRRAVLPWRAAGPRRSWVLLLLAGLLAVMVGGMLVVGSQLQRRLPAVVPPVGQLCECPPGSTPDEPGPADQAGPPEADMGVAFDLGFDRRSGRLVEVTSAGGAVETWTFDVCANTWTQMHPNREPPPFGWGKLVYDIDSDVTILVSNDADPSVAGVSVWAYDLQADTWTEKGPAPTDAVVSLAYDPVSRLVVAGIHDRNLLMWTYDVEADRWTPIQQAGAGPSDGAVFVWGAVFAYDASVDRMVAYTYAGEFETWLFDVRTGTWSRSSAQTPVVTRGLGLPNVVYDEAAKRTVIVGNVGAAAYDASANRWEMLVAYPRGSFVPATRIVYDPVHERFVGPGGYYNDTGVQLGRAAVFAFDPGTREWTVLLAPGKGQPANAPATMPAPTSARTPAPSGEAEETGPTAPVPTASPTSAPQ